MKKEVGGKSTRLGRTRITQKPLLGVPCGQLTPEQRLINALSDAPMPEDRVRAVKIILSSVHTPCRVWIMEQINKWIIEQALYFQEETNREVFGPIKEGRGWFYRAPKF